MDKKIIPPGKKIILHYLDQWKNQDKNNIHEKTLSLLFQNNFKENNKLEEVLIKVSALNDFYSTNIFDTLRVARHIVSLNIDQRLKQFDESLVNEVALVSITAEKKINFYSFATKYCYYHQPEHYPIYDNYVKEVLCYFNKKHAFTEFHKTDLLNYPKFKGILVSFRNHFQLNDFTLRELDKYLWSAGKEYFGKQ